MNLKSEENFVDSWKQIHSHHRQQIISINIYMSSRINESISSALITDSSLDHLESLALCELGSKPLPRIEGPP